MQRYQLDLTLRRAEGALARLHGTVCLAHCPRRGAQIDEDPALPPSVPERAREGLGFPQVRIHSLALSEGVERVAQFEAKIDGLLQRVRAVGKVPQGLERLLKVSYCLAAG